MLHVVLLILKILGIILLVITGLVLFGLYAVFFMALPYRIELEKRERIQATASVSWLFRIVTVRVRLNSENGSEPEFRMRLFGYPLWQNVKKESRWKRLKRFLRWIKRKFASRWRHEAPQTETKAGTDSGGRTDKTQMRSAKETILTETEAVQETKEEKITAKEASLIRTEAAEEPAQTGTTAKEASLTRAEAAEEPARTGTTAKEAVRTRMETSEKTGNRTKKKKKAKKSIFQKVRCTVHDICVKIRQIWKKFARIGESIRSGLDRKHTLWDLWNGEENRRARETILEQIRYMWKKSRPKKIKGSIHFGFEDPAQTGLCMGAAGMLYAWYPKKLEIVPDFDREILEGNILIKGKVRVYVFVRVLWNIYQNKDIRQMYRYLRK